MKSSFRLVLVAALAMTGGCKNTCCRKQSAAYVTTPPPGATIVQPQPQLQPQPLPPVGGPPAEVLPPAAPPPGVGAAPTGVAPAPPRAPSGYAPIAKLDAVAPAIHLLPPELGESIAQASAVEPAPAESKSAAPALPAGIPDFAPALGDRVANGRKPMLDGLDWLQANGFRGALMLRTPGASDSADRTQFETRGMTFASLEVSLSDLSRGTVDEFNRLVADAGRQPLFVYDADGSIAGPLWYLHFRRVQKLDDEAAGTRAERLGLRLDEKEKRLSWLAVQDFLSRNP